MAFLLWGRGCAEGKNRVGIELGKPLGSLGEKQQPSELKQRYGSGKEEEKPQSI